MPHTDLIQDLWGSQKLVSSSTTVARLTEAIDFFSSLKRLSQHMFKADGTDDAPEGLMCSGHNVWTVWDGLASVCWLHVGGVRSGAAVMQSQHGGVPSFLTAAPMYGQYGDADSYRTARSYPVPATTTLPPPAPVVHPRRGLSNVKTRDRKTSIYC